MSHYLHLVFSSKYRQSTITEESLQVFSGYFKVYLNERSIEMLACNGHKNHVHLLIKFEKDLDLPAIVKGLKGGAARQLNETKSMEEKFKWSVGYFAQRVTYSRIYDLIGYIENQKEHHKKPRTEVRGCGSTNEH